MDAEDCVLGLQRKSGTSEGHSDSLRLPKHQPSKCSRHYCALQDGSICATVLRNVERKRSQSNVKRRTTRSMFAEHSVSPRHLIFVALQRLSSNSKEATCYAASWKNTHTEFVPCLTWIEHFKHALVSIQSSITLKHRYIPRARHCSTASLSHRSRPSMLETREEIEGSILACGRERTLTVPPSSK